MLKTILYAFCVVLLATSGAVTANQDNSKILNQSLRTIDGNAITLSDLLLSKPVYLKFWASWCKPCLEQMPHLQHIQESWGDKVNVIAVNIDMNETNKDINAVKQRYGLTMPIVKDTDGQLAKHSNFVGTPYHVLMNKQGDIVHKGHDATKSLDHKISLLAKSDDALLEAVQLTNQAGASTALDLSKANTQVLYITATFCDWYLADSRPAMSKACIESQKQINQLHQQFSDVDWQIIVSHLWTGPKELQEYRDKYDIRLPLSIDSKGDIFFRYNIRHFPTMLVIQDKEMVLRTSDTEALQDFLRKTS